ncbi:MAG: tRNA pseudouridine(55) synthase TruB [Spirochaetota bacterium]
MSLPAGIALLAKPAGITSFQALGPVKKCLGTRKIGHTGTLDKFASGLLVLLVGSYTRLGSFFTALDKLYLARMRFGEETETLDPEGSVIATAPAPTFEALREAACRFRGPIQQAPPAYSAIHLDGERASDRARRGETLEMKLRPVTISKLEILDYDGRDALVRVRCSSGTYIRSLARDLALATASRAHLVGLERLEVGPFRLADAHAPSEIAPGELANLDPDLARRLGLSPWAITDAALDGFRKGVRLAPTDLAEISPENGAIPGAEASPRAVFSIDGIFRGVVAVEASELRYRFVLESST